MKLIDPKKSVKTVSKIGIVMGVVVALVVVNVLFTMATGIHFRSGENILSRKAGSGYSDQTIIANRGHIYDRSGDVIAQDIESYDLFAYVDESRVNATDKPVYVVDCDETSKTLASIIETDPTKVEEVAAQFKSILEEAKSTGKYQVELGAYGKNLSAEVKSQIEATKLPGLEFTKSTTRVYPAGVFASQLIGYTNYTDNGELKGETGIESYFDKELTGSNGEVQYQTDAQGNRLPNTQKYTKVAENGNDVYLTLDKDTQLALEKALQNTMESNSANYAWGIVMEAKTGRILAQAGYPSFDLNTRENITNFYNLPSDRPFEVGSVMKAFVYAAAMNEGVYDGNALFASKQAKIGLDANNNPVRDDSISNPLTIINDAGENNNYGTISFDEGLIRSTNTAITSLLTNYLSLDKNIEYLKNFKLFEPVDIYGLPDTAGTLNLEYPLSKMTLGFGQGSTVNSYEIVQAASAIFGNGTLIKPYIVDKIVDPNTGQIIYEGKTEEVGQPITDATAKQIQGLLRRVVEEPYGTAHHYQLGDITMMAKTGTGELVLEGENGYSTETFTSSILAAAPAEDPEIIVYYAFESKNIRNYDTSYFKDIVRESLTSLNKYNALAQTTPSEPTEESTDFSQYTMPALVNHSREYVADKLSGFNVNVRYIGDGATVISQFPLENTTIISKQNLFLLTDGNNVTLPNMIGWSRKDVAVFAQLSGLDVSYQGSGKVSKQSLSEGAPIVAGDKLEVELE